MPPEAAPAPAPAAVPAVVSTPVAPAPAVSPAPAPGRPKPVAQASTTITKSYGTATPKRFEVRPTAVAAPSAPVAAAPAAVETSAIVPTETPSMDGKPAEGIADKPAELELLPTDKPAETPAAETETAEAEPPKVDRAEEAKRLARIARAEAKLSEAKRAFATEQSKHAEALSRVAQMDKAKDLVQKDPIGFLHRMWGITPQQIVDHLVATTTGKPVAGAGPAQTSATDERIAALETQLKEAATKSKEQDLERQTREWIRDAVVPIVSDATKYPFLNYEFGGEAAHHVYLTIKANWERDTSKPPPSPQVVADFIEKHFRDKAAKAPKLPSDGAVPPQTANPNRVAAPQAAPKPAAAQTPPAALLRRPRLTGKPYTVTVK